MLLSGECIILHQTAAKSPFKVPKMVGQCFSGPNAQCDLLALSTHGRKNTTGSFKAKQTEAPKKRKANHVFFF